MAKRLVLFDIDGTLIRGGSLWAESFYASIKHFFPQMPMYKINFGGKTDLQIYKEILAMGGHGEEVIEKHLNPLSLKYLEIAREKIKTRSQEIEILPGVARLVQDLANHPDVHLGLLTGNLQEGAKAKLSCVGLWDHFQFGVYADDHWDRYQLPSIAVKKVEASRGLKFSKKQIVIIGDTMHDVNCGKTLGVRTIGVGTGSIEHRESMLAQNPDYYFNDLSQTNEVIESILEEMI